MLPKANRLNKLLFKLVSKKGKKVSSNPKMIFLLSKDNSFKTSIVVPKKTLKKAVDRNRLRRRIYSAISKIESKPKGWLIIYPSPHYLKSEFQIIKDDFIKLFSKLN